MVPIGPIGPIGKFPDGSIGKKTNETKGQFPIGFFPIGSHWVLMVFFLLVSQIFFSRASPGMELFVAPFATCFVPPGLQEIQT